MEFKNDELNLMSVVPWDKSQSETLGIHAYASPDSCKNCGSTPLIRFTETDECLNCSHKAFSETWLLWIQGSPDRPEPFPRSPNESAQLGVDYFYRDMMCTKGQGKHFCMPHVKTGRCVACAQIKRQKTQDQILMDDKPDMVIPRDVASTFGYKVFRTGQPCRKGHKGWRYVSTGACVSCISGLRNVIEMMPENPPIITISQQLPMFIGYSYHGRKFQGSDGKRWNKLQFNSMFPSMAIYETRIGSVSTAAEAFIMNFVDNGN